MAGRALHHLRRFTVELSQVRVLLLGGLLVGATLAFGGQHAGVMVVLLGAGAALLALTFNRARPPALAWLLLALAGASALQLLALPAGLVAWLSPAAGVVWTDSVRALGEAPAALRPLSVDPSATLLEVCKYWLYFSVAVAASAVGLERGMGTLTAVVFVTVLLLSLVTLGHGLVDTGRVFGTYQPTFDVGRWQTGPLLNSNNLAGLLNLGLGAAAALALMRPAPLPRWLVGAGAAVMTGQVVQSGSRGGMLALALCSAGGALLLWRRRLVGRQQRALLGAGAAASLGLMGVVVASPAARSLFLGSDTERKLAAWRWTLDLLRDYPLVGVGRGAYESSFPAYRGFLGYDWTSVFAYPENLPLQWLAEWGLLFGGAGLGALLFIVARATARAVREPARLALALGALALFLQNLVDLSLEIPAVMLAWVVALVALDARREDGDSARPRPRRGLLTLLMAASLWCLLGLAGRSGDRVSVERAELSRAYRALSPAEPRAVAHFKSELAAAIRRHPAEPFLPLLGGLLAHRLGDDNALRWLGQALARGPTTGTIHLALADVLAARRARSQALLHLRLAARYDATLRSATAVRAARWARDQRDLEQAFEAGADGGRALSLSCPHLPETARAVECWRSVIARVPGAVASRESLGLALATLARESPAACPGGSAAGCHDEVRALAERLEQRGHWSFRLTRALIAAEAPGAERKRATQALMKRCPASEAAAECLRGALDLASVAGDTPGVRDALERLLPVLCESDAGCAEGHDLAASHYQTLGAAALSLRHRQLAVRDLPTASRWLYLAEAALHTRSTPTATLALRRARTFVSLTAAEQERLAALEARLQEPAREPGAVGSP